MCVCVCVSVCLCVCVSRIQAASTFAHAHGPRDTVRTLDAVGASVQSTTVSLNEMHAHLRTVDSSVDSGLAKLGSKDGVVDPPSKVLDIENHTEEEDEANSMKRLLPRLQAHRIRCAERSLSLFETLRTDLNGIDAEARRRAEELRARHDAELARAVQGGVPTSR